MKIRRFIAEDMRTAMHKIREDFGEDAVILTNRRTADGLEIIAAVDYDETLFSSYDTLVDIKKEEDKASLNAERNHSAEDDTLDNNEPTPSNNVEMGAMRLELQNLRGLLEHQLSGLAWHDLQTRKPHEAELLKRLLVLGIEPSLSKQLATQVFKFSPESGDFNQLWHDGLDKIASLIPVAKRDIAAKGGVISLVGPSGVGKTTTIAKLAARYVMETDPNGLGLITLDSQRIGAAEHLRTYARILGVHCRTVDNIQSLSAAIESFYDKKLILIDTPGNIYNQNNFSSEFLELKNSHDVQFVLTLSATSQYAVLKKQVDEFSQLNANVCIMTKLDEAASLGEAISILLQHNLSLAYTTNGQAVPDDIKVALPQQLVSHAVQLLGLGQDELKKENNETLALQISGLLTDAY